MTYQTFIALVFLSVATLFTPGPNNAMLATSGAAFGFRRTLPHALGVALGFPVMMLIVGLLLGGVFQASPLLRETLKWGGAALLLWIAYKIAISRGMERKDADARPMSFMGAAAFQWINPKGWSMAISATALFIDPAKPFVTAMIVVMSFLVLGLASSMTWVAAGQAISGWLTTERRQRFFNITMAVLIVLSIVELVRH
jgi:threonine/homoserine/homoserine lactone efflux protein